MKRTETHNILKEQLQAELKRRQSANAAYSLRAFARDLELNPGFLSSILSGTRQLSMERSTEVLSRLGYTSEHIANFIAPPSQDEDADDFGTLQLDQFQIVADWYHFAIMELVRCKDFDSTPTAVAKRLGISENDAQLAVQRLVRIGLLERKKNGKLARTQNSLATPSGIPSRSLRAHHAQMIEKSKLALESQSIDERDITGLTISIDPKHVPALKEEIKKFRRRIARLLDGPMGKDPTEVFQLGVQLFKLSQAERKKP